MAQRGCVRCGKCCVVFGMGVADDDQYRTFNELHGIVYQNDGEHMVVRLRGAKQSASTSNAGRTAWSTTNARSCAATICAMRHGKKCLTVPSTFSADAYVKQLLAIYEGAEQQCFALIAKYGTQGRDAPDWLARRTGALQRMKREMQQIVDQLDGKSGDLVRRAVEKAHREGWNAAISELDALGEAGMVVRPSVEAIAQLAQTAVDAVQATHLRILRETQNLAQQILGAGAQDILQGSLRAATAQTVGEAMTGTLTRRTASQLLLDRIADSGITGFVDKAGRAWSLSSYVEMAVRSATAQATIQGQKNAYAERGHDLVIVSDSPEEGKLCRYWEGRVLSEDGKEVHTLVKNHFSKHRGNRGFRGRQRDILCCLCSLCVNVLLNGCRSRRHRDHRCRSHRHHHRCWNRSHRRR